MFDWDSVTVISTEISPQLCIVDSSNHAQQGVDERVFQFGINKGHEEMAQEICLAAVVK